MLGLSSIITTIVAAMGFSTNIYVHAAPTTDVIHSQLNPRGVIHFEGYSSTDCGAGLINNGPLNEGCFNLAAATRSFSPSGNSGCVVFAYTCFDCDCNDSFSGFANGQCVEALVVQPGGGTIFWV